MEAANTGLSCLPRSSVVRFHVWQNPTSGFPSGTICEVSVDLPQQLINLADFEFIEWWGAHAARSFERSPFFRLEHPWLLKPITRLVCLRDANEFYITHGSEDDYNLRASWPAQKLHEVISFGCCHLERFVCPGSKYSNVKPDEQLLRTILSDPEIVELRNRQFRNANIRKAPSTDADEIIQSANGEGDDDDWERYAKGVLLCFCFCLCFYPQAFSQNESLHLLVMQLGSKRCRAI